MASEFVPPLASIEPRLRPLLPADLYATTWVDPSPDTLMEATAARGRAGAGTLLRVLNSYFAEMIEIISKSGGNLLEFTGDAILAQFPADERGRDTAQAVRAGLRMQRAMARFASIQTAQGNFSLNMRLGIHRGRYLSADIGTP